MSSDVGMDRLESVVSGEGETESDEDDEYEFLDMTDLDEEYLDSGDRNSGDASVLSKIPFSRIHQPALPFEDSQRKCFLPGQKISVEVIDAEPADHGRLLNPNIYTVRVRHGEYEWIVRRRYKHFRQIHEHLTLLRAGAKLPVPTTKNRAEMAFTDGRGTGYKFNRHRLRRKSFKEKKQSLPKFPKRPDPLVRVEHMETRKKELGEYLQNVLRHPTYRKDHEVQRFLEVSHLSFVNNLGQKWKEGVVKKRSGGRKIALHWCSCCRGCTPTIHWHKSWLMVKDSFVAYVRPDDGVIRDVLLMDQEFVVKHGLMQTGIRHGLMVSNLSRDLLVKCWTQRKAKEWYEQISKASLGVASDFTQPNRFTSFAPVRNNAYTTWFVDGATYMAAVADAIETAKEEIFITDWWLSPELYLKRPVTDPIRWRLDCMLEKKAREGVKIYIQIYKEMEVALGINSFYSKQALSKLHPNIQVMRHPDGINLWSHHEKSVIIDQRLAFLGGIDLCWGRWDTRLHRLTDLGSLSLEQFYGEGETKTAQKIPISQPRDTNQPGYEPPLDTIPENESAELPAITIERIDTGLTEETVMTEGDEARHVDNHVDDDERIEREALRITDGGFVNPSAEPDNVSSGSESHDIPPAAEVLVDEGERDNTSESSDEESRSPVKQTSLMRQPRVIEESPVTQHKDVTDEDSSSLTPRSSRSQEIDIEMSMDQNANETTEDKGEEAEMTRGDSVESTSGIEAFRTYLKDFHNQTYTILQAAVDEHAARDEGHRAEQEPEENKSDSKGKSPRPKSRFRAPKLHLNMPHMTKSRKAGSPSESPSNSPSSARRDPSTPGSLGSLSAYGADGVLPAQPKPTTPTLEKKRFGLHIRERFRKQKSMSIDITEDRPQDTELYFRKELESVSDPEQVLDADGQHDNLRVWIGKDYVNFIFKDLIELDKPFTDFVDRTITPRMPWHDIGVACFGRPARDVARHFIQRWNFTKLQKQKDNKEVPMLLPKSYSKITVPSWVSQSAFTANCQILRSSSEWSAGIKTTEMSIHNAYVALIESSKHFIFIENQFFISITDDNTVENKISDALYKRIVKAHTDNQKFRVYVILPLLPAFEGEIGTARGTSIQAVTHWNYSSICRGGKSLLERLVPIVNDPFKYISFYGLRTHEELIGNMMTELVYVHSKLMIVDDFSVIIGSANINDRSLIGKRDSELAIVVQDTQTVDSVMNGQPYKAGAFASSLRKNLFREHLGVTEKDMFADVTDPVCDHFYKSVWLHQASVNTSVYEKVFCCLPTDTVTSFKKLKEYQEQPRLIDTDPAQARAELKRVKGHLVLMPLQFLAGENLAPAVGTKESLAPTVIWT